MDFEGIGRVAANTTLAACAAGLTAMFAAYLMTKKWDVSFTVNGFLAGLVAITCPCYWVSSDGRDHAGRRSRCDCGAAALNCWSGCVSMILSARFRSTASAASGVRGRWVCSPPASTARPVRSGPDNSAPLAGLFYHGGVKLLEAQILGNGIITIATFGVSLVLMYAVNAMGILRVSREGELYGLDLHEHGISAYPEYVITALGSPSGSHVAAD